MKALPRAQKPRSLRWRLTAAIAAGGVMVALLAAGGFCELALRTYWVGTRAETEALGAVVAQQVAPAVAAGDPNAADAVLASMEGGKLLRESAIYDARGGLFAGRPQTILKAHKPLPPDGLRTVRGAIVLTRPVTAGNRRLGTLVLVAALPPLRVVRRQFLWGAVIIIILSSLGAVAIGMLLQSRVSAPVLEIARVAQRIAQTHGYQERVCEGCHGELSTLARSFNAMLDEIGRRDQQLAHQQRDLEDQVAERTRVNGELRVAKEAAEEAARLKTEFLANMSHEIRTPLNGVVGMISLVLDETNNDAQRDQLMVALSAARSLVTILNDILDLSKLEAGKMTVETIDFDLLATVRDSVRMFESAAAERQLTLALEVAPECPAAVRGDPVRLRQILVNLVGNAVKFTVTGGVRVVVQPAAPGWLRFAVSDTGIGVPREKLESIFEPFTQADGSHTRRFGGTGLGLTITRRLVGLMGGRLHTTSESGRGSTFAVELPLEAGTMPMASPPGAQRGLATAGAPLHVLVAEDNPVNQKVVEAMLRRRGHGVAMAQNGAEAFQCFLREPFDLVLMDIQMPEVDGLEATRMIREEERRRCRRRLPILALTAHASPPERAQCLVAGMDGVLTKPIDLDTLADAISRAAAESAALHPEVVDQQ